MNISFITNLFKKVPTVHKYSGLSDFSTRASNEEMIEVFTEAAHRANADQRAVVKAASQ